MFISSMFCPEANEVDFTTLLGQNLLEAAVRVNKPNWLQALNAIGRAACDIGGFLSGHGEINEPISAHLQLSLAAFERAVQDAAMLASARKIADIVIAQLSGGNKLLIIGNGGSAADAQHIAAEIVGRYRCERPAYPAIALTTDTSALTAISNDYGFEHVFVRQLEGLGMRGDVLLALSTSGSSPNILAALSAARERGIVTIGFTGRNGRTMGADCDYLLVAPSDETPIVQQIHLAVAHGICDTIEQTLMNRTL